MCLVASPHFLVCFRALFFSSPLIVVTHSKKKRTHTTFTMSAALDAKIAELKKKMPTEKVAQPDKEGTDALIAKLEAEIKVLQKQMVSCDTSRAHVVHLAH